MTYFDLEETRNGRTPRLGISGSAPDEAPPLPPAAVLILAPLLGVCLWAALIYSAF